MLLLRYRHRRRKLFLPPGYIVLSLFVWVASLCVLKHKRMEPVHVIEISYPSPNMLALTEKLFRAKKNNWQIQLSEKALLFEKQLSRIDSVLDATRQHADTNLLIEMAFDDKLPYQHFISVIDLFFKNEHRRFWISDSKITALFYAEPPTVKVVTAAKEKKLLPAPPVLMCCRVYTPPSPFEQAEIEKKNRMIQAKADRERQSEVFPFFGAHFLLLLAIGIISFWKLHEQKK